MVLLILRKWRKDESITDKKKEINGRIRRVLFLKYKTCPFEDRGNRFRMSHGHLNLNITYASGKVGEITVSKNYFSYISLFIFIR